MSNGPVELHKDNNLRRRLESLSVGAIISGMLLVFAIVCSMFGIVIGIFITTLEDVKEDIAYTREEVTEQLSVNEIYFTQLRAWASSQGIQLPEREKLEEEEDE